MTISQINLPRYGNVFINTSTFADLRAIPTTKIVDGYSAIVAGAYAPADGLGGLLVWNATSTVADNDLTVIAPADGGGGRWLKIAVGVPGPQGNQGSQGAQGPQGAIGGNVMAIGSFQAAAGSTIAAGASLVKTSSFATGATTGAANYVYDVKVNAAFVAANPKASFLTSDGRGFRLAENTLTVEMFGAVGDGVTNDQPAIQACLDWAAVAGVRHVQFCATFYALWCPTRTTTAYTDYNQDGIPMVVKSTMLMEPRGAHTTLNFLSKEGLDRTTHYQTPPTPGNQIWRGGGIYVVGDSAANSPLKVEYFAMKNMKLDGGIQMTGFRGDPNSNNGRGWDQTDKGFRFQDQYAGDFYFENVEITRFSGEILYGGGNTRSCTTVNTWLHNTDGDAYNWANNCRMLDIGSRWGEAYQPIEGCAGLGIRLVGTEMYDCYTAGGILGGFIGGARDASGALLPNTNYAEFYVPTTVDIPWIDLDDITIRNCNGAQFAVGSYTRGTINCIDAGVNISSGTQRVLDTVDLQINVMADKVNVGTALYLSGPSSDTLAFSGSSRYIQRPANINVRLTVGRTLNAATTGKAVQQPLAWDGLYGDNVWVVCDNVITARAATAGAPTILSMPGIRLSRFRSLSGSIASAATGLTNVGANNAIRFLGPIVSYTAGAATTGDYQVTVDTTGYQDGQLVDVTFYGGGSTMTFTNGKGVRLLTSQTPSAGGTPILTLANNGKATFKFDAARGEWMYVSVTSFAY